MSFVDVLASELKLKRDHQVRAVRAALEALLVRGQRGIVLADEVGCGKTYEALGVAALLWKHFHGLGTTPIERILVVAEPALLNKWFNEIETPPDRGRGFQQYVKSEEWAPFLEILRGVRQIRHRRDGEDAGNIKRKDRRVPPGLYVVKPLLISGATAGDASPLVRWMKQTDWDLVIVDEAHHFTNLKTERSRVFFPDQTIASREQGLRARFTLALTATPFQLATAELLNLVRIVGAPENDIESLRDGLILYESALEQFYARRRLAPTDDARQRWVARLDELRATNASGGARADTPGLQALLRRYFVRNVRDGSERDYALAEHDGAAYSLKPFGKLDDLRLTIAKSPLLPLTGDDAWVYLGLRDLLVDAEVAAREESATETPSFVAGDLRQCLSSYEQLAGSAVLAKQLPRAAALRTCVAQLQASGHVHPKIRAVCAIVESLVEREIALMKEHPGRGFQKILLFNSLMQTAGALRNALLAVVQAKVDPFVQEQVVAAGWADLESARAMIRDSLRRERETARERLRGKFDPRFLAISRDMLAETNLSMAGDSRELVDVMFDRADEHCTQPLFLLRMATWLLYQDQRPDEELVQMFLMKHVGEKLTGSLDTIVDDFLDDTPRQGVAFSEENLDRARREIGRVAGVLAAPKYVARFDGRQSDAKREMRRENFNRPYSPLVLLVSRVGEEGIDLQQHTRYVLHYDVEWNPAKMEQREGRVDREGRRTSGPVEVRFFLLKDTYEERIFHTVMQRDAWFQVLIGSKRAELAKRRAGDDEEDNGASVDVGPLEDGRLTAEERARVMIDLRP